MFEAFLKIWYFIIILPIYIAKEGYEMFKKYMKKNNYSMDWIYVLYALLAALIIILIVLLAYGYPW
jgi:NhaP-type Na+/H+ or K+/H+ antiporter